MLYAVTTLIAFTCFTLHRWSLHYWHHVIWQYNHLAIQHWHHSCAFLQGIRLRQIVDDRYTASVLLGLSQTFQDSAGENHNILSSVNICRNAYAIALAENNWFGESASAGTPTVPKRIRRRGKYTPQERERIRLVISSSAKVAVARHHVFSFIQHPII